MSQLFKKSHAWRGTVSVCLLAGAAAVAAPQAVLTVSPGGSDAAPGTAAAPLASLEGARDKVRALLAKGKMTGDIVVTFKAGDYMMDAPVAFGPEDSGKDGHKIVYRHAEALGSARFIGGRKVMEKWSDAGNGICTVDIGTNTVPHTLYVDGVRLRKARYPNHKHNPALPSAASPYLVTTAGQCTGIGGHGATAKNPTWLQYAEGDIDPAKLDMSQLRINTFPWGKCDWHRMLCKVISIDPETRRITFDNNDQNNPQQERQRYFLEDDRSFLDAPGEFSFDEETGVLHLIPRDGQDPSGIEVIVPTTPTLVRFVGTEGDAVHDIRLEGLQFYGTNLDSPAGYAWFDEKPMVLLKHTRNLAILNCRLTNGGRSGIGITHSSHALIYGNLIQFMGMNGLVIFDSSYSTVSNNKIHDVGYLQIYAECIGLFRSHNIEVSHCELFNSARYALTTRGNVAKQYTYGYTDQMPSFNNRFHHLKAYGLCQDSGDTGGFHAAQINGPSDPYINFFDQITIDDVRADPSMKDHAPDGIFLDWPDAAMHQRFSNMKVTGMQSGKAVRSNRPGNQRSAIWQNVSWLPGFDESKLNLDAIGLKADFPAAYGGNGEPTQLPELPAVGDIEFARYRFDGNYQGDKALSTINHAGDPEFSSEVHREGDASVHFDGDADLVSLTTDLRGDFTVSLWAKYEKQTDGESAWRPIVYSGSDFDKGSIVISTQHAGAGDHTQVHMGIDPRQAFDVAFNDGNWHFLVLTRIGDTWKAYHNGTLLGEGKIGTYTPDSMCLQIGGDRDSAKLKRNFTGYIDDVRTWNYALSDEAIAELYQAYPVAEKVTAPPIAPMHKVAKAVVRPVGAPDYANVCFRYGWMRETLRPDLKNPKAHDVEFPSVDDAKKALRAFHATRVDWFYPGSHTADPGADYVSKAARAFIDWCHAHGIKVGGAMNTLTTHKPWDSGVSRNMGRYRGDPNNPGFVAAAVAWGKAQIDAGVGTLVCDDLFGYRSAKMEQLFSDNVIKTIKAHKEGFTIAGNNGGFMGTRYVENYAFDFHYSDNHYVPTPGRWWAETKAHRVVKSAVLLHQNRPISKPIHRQMIALGYANGAHVITPWDEYIYGKGRLFADPADFADLYGFARALGEAGYLNGYEDAAVGGYDLKETRYGVPTPITVTGGSGKLSVFARAKPGDAEAPVVLHLVDSGEPKKATIKLRSEVFFKSVDLSVSLLVPPPYEKAAHEKASTSGDYSTLMQEAPLKTMTEGNWTVIEVPAVSPWGVLVVEREQ